MDLTDDGATFLDEGPETPAPLFAVRAFKTAIFGTPKAVQYKLRKADEPQTGQQQLQKLEANVEPALMQTASQRNVGPD